jgi:DNA-binding response OmpR family regulator
MAAKIAIIEDELPIAEETRDILIGKGYEATIFQTIEDAKTSISASKFDAWLLDLNLNGNKAAGIELATWAGKNQLETPILVVSGLPTEPYKQITRALGLWDFLSKPVDATELIHKLEQLLKAHHHPTPSLSNIPGLEIDPTYPGKARWKNQRFSIPLTPLRMLILLAQRNGETVTYPEFYGVLETGRSKEAVRQNIRKIRESFTYVDPDFDKIKSVTGQGYRWEK